MTRTHFLLLAAATLFLIAWLAPGTSREYTPPAAQVRRSEAAVRADQGTADAIRTRTRDLKSSLSSPRPFRPVARNPFVFGGQMHSRPAVTSREADADQPAVAERPARPDMVLEGVAEDGRPGGGVVRTAVISALGQLFFAKEGDRLLARFLIVRVGPDVVQLKDGEGGEVFTLALR